MRTKYTVSGLLFSFFMLLASAVWAQPSTGSIRGQVTDPSAAAIPNAAVTVSGEGGFARQARSDPQGQYVISGLPPGKYTLRVAAKGFNQFEAQDINVSNGALSMNIPLSVAMETQSVTVSTDTNSLTTDPSQNVGALVLKGADLESLSDDPDDLANDLQALAGPAAGPNGGQIYIDGFTGGQLPPKSAIREVRINSNPFSAEYDRLGFGRIEILTKPGSDKFRGQVFGNFGNQVFNSRNPFVTGTVPDYSMEFFGGNVSGPLGKKASFFFDIDRRMTDENALIVAKTLDPSYNIVNFNDAVVTPQRRLDLSPRIDYQITPNNTLMARYRWSDNSTVGGVGGFALPTQTSYGDGHNNTFQLTETAVLGTHAVNETRFQYFGSRNSTSAVSNGPTIAVQSAFTGGSAPFSLNYTNMNEYELQNYTTVTKSTHQVRFGVRIRGSQQDNQSTSNYNGTYTFAGGRAVQLNSAFQPVLDDSGQPVLVPFSSIDLYRTTELLLANGVTAQQAAVWGYAPNQFSLTAGSPLATVDQVDWGFFAQDDWRFRQNVTISAGLRYEGQTNINDKLNFAPRLGIAWAPRAKKSGQPKTVIRAGAGMFYDRFDDNYTLDALRLNGVTQQQFLIPYPTFYPTVPSPSTLQDARVTQAIRETANNLRAPRIFQTAVGVERQLPWRMSVSANWTRSQGWNQLRSRNINAPLPGTWDPSDPSSGVRPYGNAAGDIYLYESSGMFKQNQLMTSVQARISPRFSLFGFYVLGKAESNTDGATSFPANSYDMSSEWGRAGFDIRHRAFIGGNITAPYAITLSPFIIMNSGAPFNITDGRDLNGDSLFTDRPAFATDLSLPSVVTTSWGAFDTQPKPGQVIIPRNYGDGPGQFTINLRVGRTWGFGESRGSSGMDGFGGPGGGMHGPRGGGPGGHMGGFGGGMRGMFGGGGSSGKRYTLTLSVQARNLLNHVNLAAPVGNLSSPFFGQSTAIAGGFGPGGGGAAGNRRLEFQLRFSF